VNSLLKILNRSQPLETLFEKLQTGERVVKVGNLTGSVCAFIAANVWERLQTPVLIVAASPTQAEEMLDDCSAIAGVANVGYFPPQRLHPFDTASLTGGPHNERTEALLRLQSQPQSIFVTQPEALLEKSPDIGWLRTHTLNLRAGDDYPRKLLLSNLAEAAYSRENLVDNQGQFAVRGGLIDIFPFGHEYPTRLEYDGDVISDLRQFDPSSQRTISNIKEITFIVGSNDIPGERSLLQLLPDAAVLIWNDLELIASRLEQFLERAERAGRQGSTPASAPAPLLYRSLTDAKQESERFRQVIFPGPLSKSKGQINFGAKRPDPFVDSWESLSHYIQSHHRRKLSVYFTADTEGEKERFDELLNQLVDTGIHSLTPALTGGFVSRELGVAVLTAHELWNRRRYKRRHARFRRRTAAYDLTSLRSGDLVVHTDHGIGLYEGLQHIKVRGELQEVMRIRYQDNVILYVSVDHFGLVEKYIGSESAKPQLSKIGGTEWARTKKRTQKALYDMADELIRLYSTRKITPGYGFSPDTHWQQEMEASFEFEDTPDQAAAALEIKRDLQTPAPMDRLLCGDVGFGKTEVAVRAAFKVAQDSHQVAVLVPTTILAQQHYETFRERLAAYPVRVEVLSRFKSPKEQYAIIADLKTGQVDIVIGTHRLLSRDIEFRNLGLIIIDEEHRFGVRHKERMKQLKTSVDVLTMTATPIPRTLHLALMGARDTSQINTPPAFRLPIQTEVLPFSEDVIRDAILREIDREGQVFFVHNRVESIYAVKGMLEKLIPGLRYAVGHGQMDEAALERTMLDFMNYRYDVLICTTIIESGIDIPNVNTLIVNRADKFGLAQMYQLRGRIGRSSRQAYAYLLTPPKLIITGEARRRLSTLSELTELGSGMKIALRDLEIRGAGNLLGSQQSGFINAVGFELYTKLLEEAVQELKGSQLARTVEEEFEPTLEFNGTALLPADYIDNGDLRYDVYRRLAHSKSIDEVDNIAREITDRFGRPPMLAGNLLELARLKILCRQLRFNSLTFKDKFANIVLELPEDAAEAQKRIGKFVAAAEPETIEFRVAKNVELVYRLTVSEPLKQTRLFLQRLHSRFIFKFENYDWSLKI